MAGGVLTRTARGGRKPSAGPERPWYAVLPPGLTLDLRLRGAKKAMRVAVPVLPDVRWISTVACRRAGRAPLSPAICTATAPTIER